MRRLNIGGGSPSTAPEEPPFESLPPAPAKPKPAPKPQAPKPAAPAAAPQGSSDVDLLLVSCILGDPDGTYWPLAQHLPPTAFQNAEASALWMALQSGLKMPEDIFTIAKRSAVKVDRIFEIGRMAGIGTNFPQFLEEVQERHRLREIRRIGLLMSKADQPDPATWARQLEQLARGADAQAAAESVSAYDIPPDDDASVLLGDRYLNRGDGLVLSGSSGMGKSSLELQLAYCWALGRDFFGIKPNGPLTSLILQAEDSRGDIGEVRRSLEHGMKLTAEEIALVAKRVLIVTERARRGPAFLDELRRLVARHKPDLVHINPLQAFMDGDVTESRDLGSFLRAGLNSINEPPRFAYVVVHHTVKPPQGKDRGERLWHEVMYDMAGGAEIINWARAIISLRAGSEPGEFNLVLAKRGIRAGVTKKVEQGAGYREEPATTIYLRHSKAELDIPGRAKKLKVICWESRTPSAEELAPKARGGTGAGRPVKHEFNTYRGAFPLSADKAERTNVLQRKCQAFGEIGKSAWFRMVEAAVEAGILGKVINQGESPRFYLKPIDKK